MDWQEDHRQNYAQRAYDNVAYGQEIVLAAKRISRWEHKRLRAFKWLHIVGVVDCKLVVACLEGFIDLTPEFAKGRQACSTHPNDKVRYRVRGVNSYWYKKLTIGDVGPLNALPVAWLILEFVFDVRFPRDVWRINRDGLINESLIELGKLVGVSE
jgi:hypothetical protein